VPPEAFTLHVTLAVLEYVNVTVVIGEEPVTVQVLASGVFVVVPE